MKDFIKKINNPLFIFIFFTVLYFIIAILPKSPGMTLTNGDEPHYLIMTSSILKDQDLYLINNYKQGDYREWYPEGKLEMHLITVNGKLYPLHQVGLSLLILPGFALAGRLGAILTIATLTAIGLSLLYKILLNFVNKNLAFLISVLIGASAPIGIYSTLIYPEAVITTLVAMSMFTILKKQFRLDSNNTIILFFTAGLITIFHVKFITLLFLILLFINYKLYRKTALFKLIVFNIFMLAPTFLYLIWLNGQFDGDLLAGLRGYQTSNIFSLVNIPSGLLAYLVDRENGVLLFAPYYIYAVYGIKQIIGKLFENIKEYRKQENALFALLFTCAFIGFFTMYPDLIGGANPSGRYLLPVLPSLAILVAVGLKSQLKFPVQKKLLQLLAIYSLVIFYILVTNQIMAIPSGHESNLVNFIFKGKAAIIHNLLPNLSKFGDRIIPFEDLTKGAFILAVLLILSSFRWRRVS